MESLRKALGPPSWALRQALDRQVGVLERLGPPSWAPEGALGRQVSPNGSPKAMDLTVTQPDPAGLRVLRLSSWLSIGLGLLYLSIDLLLVALIRGLCFFNCLVPPS